MNKLDEMARCIRSWLVFVVVFLAAACTRDDEQSLRMRLDKWFALGNTSYFQSNRQCTGAMISLKTSRPRKGIALFDNANAASYAFLRETVIAVQVAGTTPAALIEEMSQSGASGFGRRALAAASMAGSCFKDTEVSNFTYEAMTRSGAILAYDRESRGLIIVDPNYDRLFYIASDVW